MLNLNLYITKYISKINNPVKLLKGLASSNSKQFFQKDSEKSCPLKQINDFPVCFEKPPSSM